MKQTALAKQVAVYDTYHTQLADPLAGRCMIYVCALLYAKGCEANCRAWSSWICCSVLDLWPLECHVARLIRNGKGGLHDMPPSSGCNVHLLLQDQLTRNSHTTNTKVVLNTPNVLLLYLRPYLLVKTPAAAHSDDCIASTD